MQRRAAWLLLGVSCTLLLLLSWAQRGHQVKKEHSQPSKEVLEVPDPSGSALPTPKAQLSAICALPEFRRGASLNATVVVFAWRRLESLRRLMRSLEHAEYCGAEVPLLVIADAGASDSVLEFVRGAKWSHGERRVEAHQGPSLGIRGMWIHMFRHAEGRNLLPFEDDIEVSPLYYWWLHRVAAQYGPLDTPAQIREKRLAGIALYTPRLNEIQYPQVKWVASKHTRVPAFLLQVPCSWGALFFNTYFEEFLAFYDARTAPPFYNFSHEPHQRGLGKDREQLGDWRVRLPNARCNAWPRSWKRFLIDFMFGRGLVMLYPSFDKQRCFSTTYMERGGHSGKDGNVEAEATTSLRQDLDPYKTPPLAHASLLPHIRSRLDAELPRTWSELPVFSLHHQQRDGLSALATVGAHFLAKVRRRGAESGDGPLFDKLVALWGGKEAVARPVDLSLTPAERFLASRQAERTARV
eukprot:Transcript_4359.p1 GENE.Transcript_4359~~Transcript_4359.p1  ORF type:complete len:474 (-),score=163.87 Transcript_4359:38-1438(-)